MTEAVHLYLGQRYEFIREEDYQRREGGVSRLSVWRSHCADCGQPFECRTVKASAFQPSRRCPEHKAPGVPVSRKRARRARAAKPEEPWQLNLIRHEIRNAIRLLKQGRADTARQLLEGVAPGGGHD
jgi:hypothetical protein